MWRRVDRGELGERQEDDGGVHPRVALDRVHLAVPLGQDKVERKVPGESSLLPAGDRVLAEPIDEITGPLFGSLPDLPVGPGFVGHQHVVARRRDKGGDLAIYHGGVCAPF